MAFKHSCFIRKNTPELKDRLKKFGIAQRGWGQNTVEKSALFIVDGHFYSVYPAKPVKHYPIIDCGTNEELFLAIAAIRDDTDKNQWFISLEDCNNLDIEPIKAGDWQFNDRYDRLPRRLRGIWKKATSKDIVRHFTEQANEHIPSGTKI